MKFISVALGLFLISSSWAWGQGCGITTTAVNFGGYDSYSQLDATGSVNVVCDVGTVYNIKIDAGANSGGGFIPRKARHASTFGTADYNLYIDIPRTEVWGDGTNGTFFRSGTGTGAQEILTIYGRLPAGQKIVAGAYGDALTVTVEW